MHRRLALVRRPSPRLAEGIVTHIERSDDVDAERALHQWEEYVRVLEARGWSVVEAPPVDHCPDGVFVEDQVVVYGDLAVFARSGAPERRGERVGLQGVLEALGYQCVEIEEPGTLDGGDVLKHGHRVWVGVGGRTNQAAVDQLTWALDGRRLSVHAVPIDGALHLKSAVTALPDGTFIGLGRHLPQPDAFDRFIEAPEDEGSHVVLLGDDVVLLSAAAPLTARLLAERGLDVATVDISEFEKVEGSVTCLSVRLRG